jgi:hypothetical protein
VSPLFFCTKAISGTLFLVCTGVKLNTQEKTLGAGEKLEDFETHFRIKFHEAPYIAAQLNGVPH